MEIIGKIFESEGKSYQSQGGENYIINTTKNADGSIKRSVNIGYIKDASGSWWTDSLIDYILHAWYTPKATKTTENGLKYLGDGQYTPSNISLETAPREEIVIQKNPPGLKNIVYDNAEAEHLRTTELLYTSFPNSDDSEINGWISDDISLSQNKSALKKLNMDQFLPENWWEDPFEIIGTNKGDKSENNSSSSNDQKELDPIALPKSFKKKSADKLTNFNPSTDTLEIDTDSFGIDSSATFATGKNKRVVKKKLAKQDFDFLYDEKKGGLYFNENGADKGFGDGGIIAILKGTPDLTSGNLEFI